MLLVAVLTAIMLFTRDGIQPKSPEIYIIVALSVLSLFLETTSSVMKKARESDLSSLKDRMELESLRLELQSLDNAKQDILIAKGKKPPI